MKVDLEKAKYYGLKYETEREVIDEIKKHIDFLLVLRT